ncbi:hypothetical protein Ddc_15410 [Ditylenchus destructor]|nr:hypothetical protein Ddc_15410 [Ditylenchus destructor]
MSPLSQLLNCLLLLIVLVADFSIDSVVKADRLTQYENRFTSANLRTEKRSTAPQHVSVSANFLRQRRSRPQYVDGWTSGTILSNFRKRSDPNKTPKPSTSENLSNFPRQRRSRPQYVDGWTSGTILSNFRKRSDPNVTASVKPSTSNSVTLPRQRRSRPQYYTSYADPGTSGTILSNLYREKRTRGQQLADKSPSGNINANSP